MEEENGEDSEMLDAMEGWDSDQDDQNNGGAKSESAGGEKKQSAETVVNKINAL